MAHGSGSSPTSSASSVFWLGMLTFSSCGMILFNKLAMHDFRFPMSLLFFQNLMSVMLNHASVQAGIADQKPLKFSEFARFVVPAFMFTIMLGSSLAALPLVTVASVIVFKNGSTLLVALGDRFYFGKKFHAFAYVGLLIMLLGGVVYGLDDLSFNLWGYIWLTINMVTNAALNIYESHVINDVDNTPMACSTYMNGISLPFIFAFAAYTTELPSVFTAVGQLSGSMLLCCCITGFLGFCISNAYTNLLGSVPATTVTVATNVNKILAMILGFLIWPESRTKLTPATVAGIVLCLGGAYVFSQARKMPASAAAAAAEGSKGEGGESGLSPAANKAQGQSLLSASAGKDGAAAAADDDDDEALELEMAAVLKEIDGDQL
jgi:drug/metabolite transporter (DMT)-like permease